jgi:hypothetical protein
LLFHILEDTETSGEPPHFSLPPTLEQQKKRMKYVISEVLKSVDVEISFFPLMPVQYVFEWLPFLPGS